MTGEGGVMVPDVQVKVIRGGGYGNKKSGKVMTGRGVMVQEVHKISVKK